MATKLTVLQIHSQMAALSAKADRLLEGKGEVVQQIREQIAAFGITSDELFGATHAAWPQEDAGAKSKSKLKLRNLATPAESTETAKPGRVFAAKFTDGVNNWNGRGREPRWLVMAVNAGASRADFSIAAGGPKTKGLRPATALAVEYSDGTKTWVRGRESMPSWMRNAIAGGAKMRDFNVAYGGSKSGRAQSKPRRYSANSVRTQPVKFTDGVNAWGGGGNTPIWLREAIASGAKLNDFRVAGVGAKSRRAKSKPKRRDPTAARTRPVKFTDGVNYWSGAGSTPWWLTAAIAGGASREDFRVQEPAKSTATSAEPVAESPATVGETSGETSGEVAREAFAEAVEKATTPAQD